VRVDGPDAEAGRGARSAAIRRGRERQPDPWREKSAQKYHERQSASARGMVTMRLSALRFSTLSNSALEAGGQEKECR
jgi:hypothetical protein